MELKKAIREVIKSRKSGFEESIDLSINLRDVDLTDPKNRLDAEIFLPHGRGKEVKVGVFAGGELAERAKKVADIISPKTIDKLAEDKKKAKELANRYDFLLAEAPLMPSIGKKLGIFLGPRGKMPTPLKPLAEPKPLVERLRHTIRARSKQSRTFHLPIGTRAMREKQLLENARAAIKSIKNLLPRGAHNIDSVYIKSTMGKPYEVSV